MKKEFTITIKNPIYDIITKYRLKKSVKKWNKDLNKINSYIRMSKKEDAYFYWTSLVWQEVGMYIWLAEQVTKKEFNELCERRGFDTPMVNYLKTMMIFVGLGKELKRS